MPDDNWTVFTPARDPEAEEEKQRRAAEAEALREAEEKARWIAERRAEDRAAAREKLVKQLVSVVTPVMMLVLLVVLGIPGFFAYRAESAAETGRYASAVESYETAAKFRLFNALFHPDRKAEELRGVMLLDSCSAGVDESQIPKTAVRLTASAQGRSGPISVELVADSEKIYRVAVIAHSETDAIGGEAARQMPDRIFRAQSVAVDGVSGATISSGAIRSAAIQALNSDAAWAAGIYPWRFGAVPSMPPPSPTMGPMPEDVKVFYMEDEREEFTEKVGESVRLHAVAYPETEFADASFRWSVSDERRIKLTVSEDTRSCTVLCLKHQSGTVTLRVDCNGFTREVTIYTRD